MNASETDASSSAQAFYGYWADVYDVIARHTPGVSTLRQQAVDACRLDTGDTVVEVGCGTGANLPYLREAVGPSGTVVGLDFTGPVLDRARAHTAAYENVHLVRADATCLPITSELSPDALLATFVVGMLTDPEAVVNDWCDLVGPDGHVVLANASRSDGPLSPVVNAAFRTVVVCSTPPTLKLRYDEDLTAMLDRKIDAAHGRLRERSGAVAEDRHHFGLVRVTGGRIAR